MIVVLMGVSGCGKTTVGKRLAAKLGWEFADADDFQSIANIDKRRAGSPLTDDDRCPWRQALRKYIDDVVERGDNLVLACSVLRHNYREYLAADNPAVVRYAYLEGSEELIRDRLVNRKGHFMPPTLLLSQFEVLEPPDNALRIDISPAPQVIVDRIIHSLRLAIA